MGSRTASEYATFFQDKVVLLTGATGNLGSCTLFKLVTQLRVQRVYAFVRGSREQAKKKLQRKLRHHANTLTTGGKVHFIIGDMCRPGMGIGQGDLQLLESEVNIIIHTAANLSLLDPIDECVKNNCDPVLELARMATNFTKLQKFVSISSVYANSFLPDGPVKEKLHPLQDATGEDIEPEMEREQIAQTGRSTFTKRFAWPYALSKYLAERLLLTRFSSLPILIVRSSTIGPAFRTPYPLFGEEESLPFQHAVKILLRDPQASSVWHSPANSTSGTNILDEIPVDWASNVLLLHIIQGTHGVVHASAGTYIQQTANDALEFALREETSMAVKIKWISADSGPQCALANLFVIGNRDWDFSCAKSVGLKQLDGPLNISVTHEEVQAFNDRRYRALLEEVRSEQSA